MAQSDGSFRSPAQPVTGEVFASCVTGIFCCMTCAQGMTTDDARRQFASSKDALEAGYHPCPLCNPLSRHTGPDLAGLLDAIVVDPHLAWGEKQFAHFGFSKIEAETEIKNRVGVSFAALLRHLRARDAFTSRHDESSSTEVRPFAQDLAFRLGRSSNDFAGKGSLHASEIQTPLGRMVAVSCDRFLRLLEFIERKTLSREVGKLETLFDTKLCLRETPISRMLEGELKAYFAGRLCRFSTPIQMHGSEFEETHWRALQEIPLGTTRSYAEMAKALGRASATRAVARANGANPLAIIVPCHRVLASNGALSGFGGGLWRKHRLLELEQYWRMPPTSSRDSACGRPA
ncbi:MAG: methylated-DNA--[protein]-cysteine S-methyltransferase [Rhodobacteraceae bacterium]|nr:methylated-DNA--[protein]-cysteine S-methyltransferase [Paracoccaceae bacterium]